MLRAAPLVWIAKEATAGAALPEILTRLVSHRFLPRRFDPRRARCATARACRLLNRFQTLDASCVVRSLVIGTILSDRRDVYLHIGFRPESELGKPVCGHAWITLDGVNISDPETVGANDDYIEAKRIPIRRLR